MSLEQLTRRWAAGWAHTRGLEQDAVAGWPRVQVGTASRTTEIICAEPSPAVWSTLLAQIVDAPTTMLTLVSDRPASYLDQVPRGVRLDRDDETLMRLDRGTLRERREHATPRPGPVPGYDLEVDDEGARLTIRLVTGGRVAAEGSAGLLDDDAVFDRIETTRDFQRRGLARWVMLELTRTLADRGARTGLLVATREGAALYRTLGWTPVAGVVSLLGGADDQGVGAAGTG